ncbi:MAG: branched-chain amino acid transport system permease protein [Acidobacteriota bacterium]|jgi:branched-chain amino acid transport system permease protein|nr:branched-chain amino acid transport system permease protein [Acidobacteriota bacterium]
MPRFLKRLLGAVVIALVLLAINMAMSKKGFFGFGIDLYQVDIWKMVGINIILAVSLNLINGFTGQFSIGHIGFMAIGAYSSAYLTVYFTQGWEQQLAGMLGAQAAAAIIFTFVILMGALAAAVAGLVVGIPTLRLRGDYLAIATLGFAEIIRIIIVNINKVGAATGFRGCVDPVTGATCVDPAMGRLTIPAYTNFMWIGVFAVITIVVIYNIVKSDTGRVLISIREDELAAQAMGVNTTRYKVTAFVISAAFAGVAGALYGHWRLPHPNDFTFVRSFEIIIMIVLGGMGSITGSVLGAVVITILPEFLRTYPYEIVILLALIPIMVPILRAIGRNRLPQSLRTGLGYYAFVVAAYAVLFAIARLILINLLSIDIRLQSVIGDISNYRLVIYSLLLIGLMLTRPQGVLGGREFGFNWLKRAQRRPEGDEAVGTSKGVPIAERDDPTADRAKEVENR